MATNSFLLIWQWESWGKPVFAFRIPIPFTEDYCLSAYFRYRPKAMRRDMNRWVIDWPWIRYSGWYDSKGNKIKHRDTGCPFWPNSQPLPSSKK